MDTRFMPKAYKNAAELQIAVSAYFNRCDNEEKRYGIFGLLFALGVTMEQFMQWEESGIEGFSETAKLARYHILNALETGTDGRAAALAAPQFKMMSGLEKGNEKQALPRLILKIDGLEREISNDPQDKRTKTV